MKRKNFTYALYSILLMSALLVQTLAGASTVTEVTYPSTTMGGNRKMLVYLPDGYNGTTFFPTFYLLHGGGQDQYAWTREGDAKGIIDRAISSGKAKPMIVVMPNVKDFAADVCTKELTKDIIPYIEKNYKATIHKDARALAGLSWGGLQVLDAGLYRYDLFGYLGVYSSGWFIGDNVYNVMRTYLAANGAKIQQSIRYFYFSEGGTGDIAYNNGMETMKLLRANGITVNYFENSGGHSFVAWKQDLERNLPFLFREPITSTESSTSAENGKVFPNPFAEGIDISFTPPYEYTFYTIEGQAMESGNDLRKGAAGSSLAAGIYILKIKTPFGIQNIKVTKQ